MKKVVVPLCILCMILIFLCCSCGLIGPQRYFCDVNEVETIQIVRIDKNVRRDSECEYTILAQISDTVSFVAQLNQLEHSVNWGDPQTMWAQYIVIKIDYYSGDFDLIHPDAQCFNRSGKNHLGFFFFNDAQFNALISDYLFLDI